MCVITAYGVQCLAAGCRGPDAGQQAMRPGTGMLVFLLYANVTMHGQTNIKLISNENF